MENAILQHFSRNGYCVIDHSPRTASELPPLPAPCTAIVLAPQGWVDLELNMERVRIEPGVCTCFSELSQWRVVACSDDLEMRLLLINREFAFTCCEGIETATLQALLDNPIVRVADRHLWSVLQALIQALQALALNTTLPVNAQVSGGLLRGVMVLLCELAVRQRPTGVRRTPYTMADAYFRQFVRLLGDHIALEHEVAFYAEQIHITPRYLNEICRRKTGRKAKEIISQLLLRNLKRELLLSGKSMKSLAADFGFADQSSLGKFFRKMTGLSPLHYMRWKSENQ